MTPSTVRRRRTYEQQARRTRRLGIGIACAFASAAIALIVVGGMAMRQYDDVLAKPDTFHRPDMAGSGPTQRPPGVRRLLPERPGVGNLAAILDNGNGFAVSAQNGQGEPVRYDPCRSIAVVVNAQLAPPGYIELVDSVLAEVSAASGLAFDVEDYDIDERADAMRRAYDPERYGDRWSPVLIAWSTPEDFPPLEGPTWGWGGSDYAYDKSEPGSRRRWYVSGTVTLDAPQFGDDLATQRLTMLHEMGHVLGLDHIDDTNQLMYPSLNATRLAAGDLSGFAMLGAGDCAPAL